jgi:putative two-component system response regulator
MARDIAAAHHEWYDGTGYPLGLAGNDIPLSARIVALADVYDALTSKRIYKEAFSEEMARNAVLQGRGTHFDPDVVDAYLSMEEVFRDIRARYHGDVLVPA